MIIVSYNTCEKLRRCLQSVFASKTNRKFEIFVADNASSDASADMVRTEFPAVKLIENRENAGYVRANNEAIKMSAGRFILLLNSDVEVSADTFDKMISFMDNDRMAGIAGCKVLKTDGTLDRACRRSFPNLPSAFWRLAGLSLLFPRSKIFGKYNLGYLPEDEIMEVDAVMGAFLMIRREVVERIGLLDEDFFMYGEDLDWAYRAKAAGYKVIYAPVTAVIHDKGSSSRKASGRALYEFHRAMQIFYDKHYRQRHNFFLNFLVRAGIWMRYSVKFLENGLRREKYVSR